MRPTVLVVDDQYEVRSVIATELAQLGIAVREAVDGLDGWKTFQRDKPDLVITDLRMPGADGIELLQRIRSVSDVPVLLLTAYGDIPTAVSAVKYGAQNFLEFPEDLDRLLDLTQSLLEERGTSRGLESQLEALIVGKSPAMQQVRRRVAGIAPLGDVPILVLGEAGTGRDHIVETLHGLSTRCDQSLRKISCAEKSSRSLPTTGAVYFDEITHLSAEEQRYILSVTTREDCQGDTEIRFYASTSHEPSAAVASETLLPEISEYFRRFSIRLPPLRDRLADIPALVGVLCEKIGTSLGRPSVRINAAGIARLKQHLWPGNVRELAGVLEQVIAFSADGAISKRHISEAIGECAQSVTTARQQRDREQREELIILLEESGGNLAEVARRLDLSRGAVHYRARKFGLFVSSD